MAILLKKMKIFGNFLGKMSSFWQFFDSQMAKKPEGQVTSTSTIIPVSQARHRASEIGRILGTNTSQTNTFRACALQQYDACALEQYHAGAVAQGEVVD